jgi:biopolymer transport protein ExbD
MSIQVQRSQVLAALSLTPLIDVVFLLLIFFLVASRLSQEDRELDVPLPTAASAQPMTAEPSELIVNINHEGQYIVAGQVLDAAGLEHAVRAAVADHPAGHAVIIRADRRVELQVPVTAMDICLRCGAGYSLSIAEEESGP